MKDKTVLTTGQVAKACRVAHRTVCKWIDSGILNGYRLPASNDRRVLARDLELFMLEQGMPLELLETEEGTATADAATREGAVKVRDTGQPGLHR